MRQVPLAQIFTFLFLMLGPSKIIKPFLTLTKDCDAKSTRQIALLSVLFSSLALLMAAFLGEPFLESYGIPLPVLSLSAGLILFLVALKDILQQFTLPGNGPGDTSPSLAKPTLNMALTPLAFPTIVTPYGIAALVVFLALSTDLQARLTIGAIALAIMLLNLAVMLVARRLPPILGLGFAILGAVLGVIQVALGLQIMNSSLRVLATF